MPTLTIKSMPDALYHRLRERAATNRRSLNSEILFALERSVETPAGVAEATLARVDRVRESLPPTLPRLTDARLRAAKASGRA